VVDTEADADLAVMPSSMLSICCAIGEVGLATWDPSLL
jgi:hypothetical protein